MLSRDWKFGRQDLDRPHSMLGPLGRIEDCLLLALLITFYLVLLERVQWVKWTYNDHSLSTIPIQNSEGRPDSESECNKAMTR